MFHVDTSRLVISIPGVPGGPDSRFGCTFLGTFLFGAAVDVSVVTFALGIRTP
jgi:hypothetical protein